MELAHREYEPEENGPPETVMLYQQVRASIALVQRRLMPCKHTRHAAAFRRQLVKGNLMVKALIAAAMLMTATAGIASTQDLDRGAIVFKKCAICHKIGPGATNLVGPVLNGLDGRHSGSVPNYSYSDANKNSGIVWNEETFAEYIKDPRAKIPGTKMIFAGIKNEQDIKDLWAYIKQFDAEGNIKK
jgi:cytochrome c